MKLPNHKLSERRVQAVSDIAELLSVIDGHGDRPIFSWREGKADVTITYADFAKKVRAFAAGLTALGLQSGRVAVIGESSPLWHCAYQGTLLAGGVVIPMDKELSLTEIGGFLSVADADAVVFSDHFKSSFAFLADHPTVKCLIPMGGAEMEDTSKVVPFDEVLAKGEALLEAGLRFPVPDRHKMSEMLFTSGTTGTSKCVMLSQENVFSVVTAAVQSVEFFPEDRVVSVLPVHHTYELAINLAEMAYGMHIYINDSLRHVLPNIKKFQPTGMILVPLFVNTMYRRIWSEAEKLGKADKLRFGIKLTRALRKIGIDIRRRVFKDVLAAFGGKLERIICGGAALNPEMITGFEDFGISVFEGYGITECSPLAAVTPYYKRKLGSVGPAVPCCELRIDKKGENEMGLPMGEVQIKGRNVMLGYYKNDEANAEVFTEDGWFRTGDMGYMDEDGYLFLTGRLKSVIVLENGKNVFPEEMEEYLENVPEILESVVVGRTAEDGTVTLCAVCVPNAEAFPEGTSLEEQKAVISKKIDEVNLRLPSFKQMRQVEVREEPFEKTTSKKIKRHLVH